MKLMKKVVVVAGISLAIVGCGKENQKTMTTSQVMSGGYLSANCTSSQLNLSVSETNNSFVANGSSGCFSSETLNAIDDGAGHLTGVTLTITIAAQQSTQTQYGAGSGYGSGIFMGFDQFGNPIYSGSGSGTGSISGTVTQAMTCSYTGTLTKSGNYVQGQLNASQYSQYSQYPQQSSNSQCPTSVYFNGALSN